MKHLLLSPQPKRSPGKVSFLILWLGQKGRWLESPGIQTSGGLAILWVALGKGCCTSEPQLPPLKKWESSETLPWNGGGGEGGDFDQ